MRRIPLLAATCLFLAIALGDSQRAQANALQASAVTSSVKISLTLGTATFPSGPPQFNPLASLSIAGAAGPQNYSMSSDGSLLTPHSLGPTQVTDVPTASTAQSASSVDGVLSNGNKTFAITTTGSALADSAFAAGADANAGTRGFGVGIAAFSQPMPATFDIDLISDFGTNSNAALSLGTSALGSDIPSNHSSQAIIQTFIDTNLPGGLGLFALTAIETWQHGVTNLLVTASDNVIQTSDFLPGPNGTFSLDPNKRHISIPFTIPAGLSFQFQVNTDTNVQIVPEPATIALASMGLVALAAICRRRCAQRPIPRRRTGVGAHERAV